MSIDCAPNLFLIGAPKCGTTSLAVGLATHSEIFIPSIKEPRYYDAHVYYDFVEDHPYSEYEDYIKLYCNAEAKKSRYRLDASVFIMYSEEAIRAILATTPNAKFLIILRHPIDAARSMHRQRLQTTKKEQREISDSFITCWNEVENRKAGIGYPVGCRNRILFRYDLLYQYENVIPTVVNLIPKDNLMLINYSDFSKGFETTLSEVFSWLNLTHEPVRERRENISLPINDNFSAKIFEKFLVSTGGFRKRYNIRGGIFAKLRKNFYSKHSLNISKFDAKNKTTISAFDETSRFLEEIFPSDFDNFN